MIRYLRLYAYCLRFSFSKAMEYRLDFFFRIGMDTVYYIINIAFFEVIYLHSPNLGGWNQQEIMIFVSSFLMVDAISMTVFNNNLWMVSQFVNKGELDYYLLRPVSSLFFLSLREFAANSLINLFMVLGIMIWSFYTYTGEYHWWQVLVYVVLILLGTLLHYFIRMLAVLPVFWTQSSKGVEVLFWTLDKFIERPERIFTGVLRIMLVTILPFAVMTSYPVHGFLEDNPWPYITYALVINLAFALLIHRLWSLALKNYSSASS